LKDIAELTGVSTNTVSLALRGSDLVTEETKRRIKDAAEEIGYRPNEIAKSLVQRQSRSIGLVLTNIVNPVLTRTAQAVETMLSQHGYSTLFATSDNRVENEIRALDAFQGRRVDGILIYPTDHRRLDHIERLGKFRLPAVLLASPPGASLHAVRLNERRGARDATRHLIALGHTKIAMIDSGHSMGNDEKLAGYLEALGEAGISSDQDLIATVTGYSPDLGSRSMDKLMSTSLPPTAVFASNDAFAFGVMDWCRNMGLSVPREISVIGFDNIEFAAYAAIPLTTVGYDPRRLATLAVKRLLSLIESPDVPHARLQEEIEPEIVVRSSTDIFR
jgi:DNA-binding LacI/PurR family transcriptional regulator